MCHCGPQTGQVCRARWPFCRHYLSQWLHVQHAQETVFNCVVVVVVVVVVVLCALCLVADGGCLGGVAWVFSSELACLLVCLFACLLLYFFTYLLLCFFASLLLCFLAALLID